MLSFITSMATKTITDRNGNQFEWSEHDGHGFFSAATNKLIPEGWEAKIKEIKALEFRNDDVMICTFPKAGMARKSDLDECFYLFFLINREEKNNFEVVNIILNLMEL